MKKITVPVLNVLLAVGLVCILSGLLLISIFSARLNANVSLPSVIMMIFGTCVFYLSLVFFHMASFFFVGMCFFFFGLTSMLISASIIPYGIAQLWPVNIILCGICLILTCLFKHKRIRGVYLFPSILMFILGVFFLLFSLDIITISFNEFVSRLFPFILITLGGFLVALFFCQKKAEDRFPYDKDELADLTDEEFPLPGAQME